MKKVIFVCLLTLSVCLSDTVVDPGNAPKPGKETAPAAKPPTGNAPALSIPATDDNKTKDQDPATKPLVQATQTNTVGSKTPEKNDTNATTNSADSKPTNSADSKPTNSADSKPTNSADSKPTNSADSKPTNSADSKPTNSADSKPTNSAESKPDNSTTTVKPTEHITPNTTAAPHSTEKATTLKPAATTVQPHTLQARGFDGASFVGGIILTLGLLAVGFMGFKYYKAQTERNYHTL